MRRVALLCIHFTRNLAFFRAGMDDGKLIRNNSFWRVVNFNFYDQSILEWCKLFADKRGKHFWGNTVQDNVKFELGLFKALELESEEFENFSDELRRCRDKFIAHLDSENEDKRPVMDKAFKAIVYFYSYVHLQENEENNYHDFPKDIIAFYNECYESAQSEYRIQQKIQRQTNA